MPAGLLHRSVGPKEGRVLPSAGAVSPGAAIPASLTALVVNPREGREAKRTAAAHNNLVYIRNSIGTCYLRSGEKPVGISAGPGSFPPIGRKARPAQASQWRSAGSR